MRSRSSCSCRERDSRDKLQSSCKTISLYNNALRSAKDRYPPVVRLPAAGQLRLELTACARDSMSINLQEQQHNHASFEAEELQRAIGRAVELRSLIRESLANLERLPSLAADQLFCQAIIDANNELASLEKYIADSPDRGQRYGLELPFSDDSDDGEMAAEAHEDGAPSGGSPARSAASWSPTSSLRFSDDDDDNDDDDSDETLDYSLSLSEM